MKGVLDKLYRDITNPAGLGSAIALYREGKKKIKNLTLREVRKFLEGNRTYTLHKPTLKRFPRQKILAPKPRVILTCDLADFSLLRRDNKGVRYILFCLDVFSRYLQAVTLTDKTSRSSLQALKTVLESEHFTGVSRLFTDQGSEFYNQAVKQYLTSKGITLYSNYSRETKASLAERLIRSIKSKIYKYLTQNNTLTYIDALPTIIQTYNHTPHAGLGNNQTPAQVHRLRDLKRIRAQFKRMYLNKPKLKKAISRTFDVGDIVRLQSSSRTQNKFNKGYIINNTEELFKIRHIDDSHRVPTYYVADLAGEAVSGAFYREELVKASLPTHYQVDILRSKVQNGKKKYLVRWRGYPDKFNSWIDAGDLTRYG